MKVPEITALFWIIKLLTTAGGEAVSDYLSLRGHLVAGVVELSIFVVAVAVQFRTRRYVAAAYWFLALAIAIFGTGVSDAMHLIVGIPTPARPRCWAVVLAAIFWLWHPERGDAVDPHHHPPPRDVLLGRGLRYLRAGHRPRRLHRLRRWASAI